MNTKQGSSGLEKFLAFVLILMIIGVGYLLVTTFLLPGQPAAPAPTSPPTEAASESDDESDSTLPPTFTPETSSAGDFDPASGEIPGLVPVGIHLVGGDGIKPGVYQGLGGEGLFDSCYWSRLKDLEETPESILANDNGTGQFYVEVLESDFALETLCELIPLAYAPVFETGGELPVGTYIVGRDIQPGNYQGQAGADEFEACYWATLSDLTGNPESISAEAQATGLYQVEVLESDYALKTACPLTRMGD